MISLRDMCSPKDKASKEKTFRNIDLGEIEDAEKDDAKD